jgi:hypothetical protein
MDDLFKLVLDLCDLSKAKLCSDSIESFHLSLSLNNIEWVPVRGVTNAKSIYRKSGEARSNSFLNIAIVVVVVG